MSGFRLRPAAQRDLAEIWLYTADNWGIDRANEYVGAIRFEIEQLGDFPNRHPLYISRKGHFRKARSGDHLLFYLAEEGEIDVVRVLHKSRDFDGQLG